MGLPFEAEETIPGWDRSLTSDLEAGLQTCMYLYDFGDDWHVALVYEQRVVPAVPFRWSRCVAGACAAPLEDSGGIHGYYDTLAAGLRPSPPAAQGRQGLVAQRVRPRTLRPARGRRERSQAPTEGAARGVNADVEGPGTRRLRGP